MLLGPLSGTFLIGPGFCNTLSFPWLCLIVIELYLTTILYFGDEIFYFPPPSMMSNVGISCLINTPGKYIVTRENKGTGSN